MSASPETLLDELPLSDLASARSAVAPGRRGTPHQAPQGSLPPSPALPREAPPSRSQCPEEPPGDLARQAGYFWSC